MTMIALAISKVAQLNPNVAHPHLVHSSAFFLGVSMQR